jgi:hypothetical protein
MKNNKKWKITKNNKIIFLWKHHLDKSSHIHIISYIHIWKRSEQHNNENFNHNGNNEHDNRVGVDDDAAEDSTLIVGEILVDLGHLIGNLTGDFGQYFSAESGKLGIKQLCALWMILWIGGIHYQLNLITLHDKNFILP